MLSTLNQTQKGILYAFCGFTSFAFADACAKWLSQHYESAHVVFWTYYIALIFGIIFSPFLGGFKKTLKTQKLYIHIGRGICALAVSFLAVSALRELSLATLYTILFLSPFLTTVAAWPVFKEPVKAKGWLIIALGFSGVVIAFRPDITEISNGMIYAFLALIFIVGLGLLSRPLHKDETLLSLSFYPSITIVLLLGVSFLPDVPMVAWEHIPLFVMNGTFVSIGLCGIAHGYRIAPFSMVAPVHYTQMVAAVLIGYFIFGDFPDIWIFAGATIIVISGIALILTSRNSS